MRLIDMDAAIDKIKKRLFETAFNNVGIKQNIDETLVDVAENRLENWFNELPSVQPEPCEDAVRREDVQAIAEKSDWFESSDSFNDFMWALYDLPSAQPERKKGTWTDDASCPFCGFQPWYERDIHTLSFCPNCGADLRGEGNGQK